MVDNIKLSPDEIKDLKIKFEELAEIFENDNNEFLQFKYRPITYLRLSGLLVMKYINNENEPHFINKFSWGLNSILSYRKVFNRCSWCKILVLTITYAICGKARQPIDVCWSLLSGIIEAIEKVANVSNEITKAILQRLNNINEKLSPLSLARQICEYLGYCP